MSKKTSDKQYVGYTATSLPGSAPGFSPSQSGNQSEPPSPVSGRYYGEMTAPNSGRFALELRVDIDPRYADSPVFNRVSGDVYQVYQFGKVYQESWVVDNPTVTWSASSVEVTGPVRYYRGIHLPTRVQIVIPWSSADIGQAEVTFTKGDLFPAAVYHCKRESNAFRAVSLEVDVCHSVNVPPLLPSYDTYAHSNRPADLPQRTLTIEECYQDAGVAMSVNPTHSIVDDSANPTWNDAELHDAMETYFSEYSGAWPKWYVWCLLASTYHIPEVAGIMFDYRKPPYRQGCAVFRNHVWFKGLPSGVPANDAQAEALREFLFCYVHEIGHGFNLMHSWQKLYANPPQTNRPDALSWMNYVWKYDQRNGPGTFWANFCFTFDDEELVHIRHGDRNTVIFGGEPFAEGAALSDIPEIYGEAPVKFIVRSKEYFHFLEPVILELKVKNISDEPMNLSTELNPEFGGVLIFIQRPDGHTVAYEPVLCKLSRIELKKLDPNGRHCQNILVSFGRHGHYFDEPGLYRIRAVYQGLGDMFVPSDIHQIHIGHPLSQDEDHAARDFYSRDTGIALYLGGSDSPFLKTAMDYLQAMAKQFQESPVGAHLSLVLGQNLARPFHRIEDRKRILFRQIDPEGALNLINRAFKQHEQDETTFQNITYHEGAREKATLLAMQGKIREAKEELKELVEYLGGKGVKRDILDGINAYAKKL